MIYFTFILMQYFQPCRDGLEMKDLDDLSEVFDDSAWQQLKKMVPSYSKYDVSFQI